MPDDFNEAEDVFVYDLVTGSNRLVSFNLGNFSSAESGSRGKAASADGRYVLFTSAASDLVYYDFNGTTDVFLRDLWSNITSLVSYTYLWFLWKCLGRISCNER